VDPVTRRSRPDLGAVEHPAWCVKERCGYLVPPLLSHMPRRHRGAALRLGHARESGLVIAYLAATHGLPPVFGLHAAAPLWGTGTAELRLPDAWRLTRHLDELMTEVGYHPNDGASDERR
jgi:hypothetical protein